VGQLLGKGAGEKRHRVVLRLELVVAGAERDRAQAVVGEGLALDLHEFSVEEHDASGAIETQFYLPDTFPTQDSAIEAAIQAGRQKIDMGFERGSAVVIG